MTISKKYFVFAIRDDGTQFDGRVYYNFLTAARRAVELSDRGYKIQVKITTHIQEHEQYD